ncbi:hypothetical protein RB601_004024 [Gaeumannomyces tritici]
MFENNSQVQHRLGRMLRLLWLAIFPQGRARAMEKHPHSTTHRYKDHTPTSLDPKTFIMLSDTDGAFSQKVLRLRVEYQRRRQASNLFPPAGQPVLDMQLTHGKTPTMSIWYQDGTPLGRYVRLFDLPGTLSGNILRLNRDLPSLPGHFEIQGDIIRPLEICPNPPDPLEDDSEDTTDLISLLPVIDDVDTFDKHFVKKPKYRSEIINLLRLQGGSCPGTRCSPHLVHLLGASATGDLVFEKLATRGLVLGRFSTLATYKRWLLHLLDALATMHAAGIVHRDLRVDNLLFGEGGETLVVCDLEGRWGQRVAPEVAWEGSLEDSGWSEKSDVYDVGLCIKGMVYANAPITPQVEWPVPEPLRQVVEACMQELPEPRPTVGELREMVEAIEVV